MVTTYKEYITTYTVGHKIQINTTKSLKMHFVQTSVQEGKSILPDPRLRFN